MSEEVQKWQKGAGEAQVGAMREGVPKAVQLGSDGPRLRSQGKSPGPIASKCCKGGGGVHVSWLERGLTLSLLCPCPEGGTDSCVAQILVPRVA